MDTPEEERSLFNHVTCNIVASVDEVTIPGALAMDLVEQVIAVSALLKFVECTVPAVFLLTWYSLSRLRWKLKGLIN